MAGLTSFLEHRPFQNRGCHHTERKGSGCSSPFSRGITEQPAVTSTNGRGDPAHSSLSHRPKEHTSPDLGPTWGCGKEHFPLPPPPAPSHAIEPYKDAWRCLLIWRAGGWLRPTEWKLSFSGWTSDWEVSAAYSLAYPKRMKIFSSHHPPPQLCSRREPALELKFARKQLLFPNFDSFLFWELILPDSRFSFSWSFHSFSRLEALGCLLSTKVGGCGGGGHLSTQIPPDMTTAASMGLKHQKLGP